MSRRLGLLGGTFDPPHLGHLVVAECARVELGLDEVRLLVAGEPWMKGATVTSAADRLRLAEAAVSGDRHLRVDDREVRRDGPTFTADTLVELRAEEPDAELFFVLGEDAAAGLPRWERVEEAFAKATFVVVTRPGHAAPAADVLPAAVVHLEVPQLEVSSTELRRRFGAGLATRYLVPDAVDAAVRELGLYGAAATAP
ncbi:MAG: nicotinate-nucleotide adenylyltransferase [Nitriliruptor sp.]|uniref:nicotinate-nucleotide adenylyltransferase n=1 Tax=Nitriliruptor sp. TaxID=2448056 RepID=UPI0034A0639E